MAQALHREKVVEYRFQDDHPSTAEFHADRDRGRHLTESQHAPRFKVARQFVQIAVQMGASSLVDLGCGDGGFLYTIKDLGIPSWGYDFSPANVTGSKDYGVDVKYADVFNKHEVERWGDLVVVTEVLEHLSDPHSSLEWIASNSTFVVASSPWGETPDSFDECHTWGWDIPGYRSMFDRHYTVIHHQKASWSQVILGRSKYGNTE